MKAENAPSGISGAETIKIRLKSAMQLFNSLDPSPFIEKDLDAQAEQFIEAWASETPHGSRLRLLLHLEVSPGGEEEEQAIGEAIRHYFSYRAEHARRELRRLMYVGRISLLIGIAFVALCIGAAQIIAGMWEGTLAEILGQSLVIVGWVAMWRPLEIFLYDWWPLARRIRLLDRLSSMRVDFAGREPA